jgi:DNA-binding transcriptional regulator YhcF (GntR family)
MLTISNLGRPSDSKNRIVKDFRDRIVAGELYPGSRFPTRVEIEQQYGAGSVTVQRALEALRYDGFIRVEGKRGTFVADNPPHLSRYAVVFPHYADSVEHSQFWQALTQELEVVSQSHPDYQLPAYYGVHRHENSEDFIRLCRDVTSHRIAGLIFTMHPYELHGTPILDEPNIPVWLS